MALLGASGTLIGSTLVVEGEITGDARVVVRGVVKGRIAVGRGVTVEEGGDVEAEIESDNVHIAGKVSGKVTAVSRIEITPSGRVTGDVRAPRILISDGAQFKGNVDME